MADQPVVHIGGDSPEQVAHKLMKEVAYRENLYDNFEREAYLSLYEECFRAVRGLARQR